MLRTAVFFITLVSLLATAAVAAPTEHTSATWRGWGFRHHHPSQGDFVPVYATYRYHSRERHGLFGFLHRSNPTARRIRHQHQPRPHATSARKHTTGQF